MKAAFTDILFGTLYMLPCTMIFMIVKTLLVLSDRNKISLERMN